jgi:hypothetical protein
MRLVTGIALVDRGIEGLLVAPPIGTAAACMVAVPAGILLLAGLWTPLGGGLAAGVELWRAFSQPGDPSVHILLGTLGTALALLGPGAWSVDARLFGWKRIHIRDRRSDPRTP